MHRYRHEVVDLGIFAASKQLGTIDLQNLPEFSVLEQPLCTSTNEPKQLSCLPSVLLARRAMVNLVMTFFLRKNLVTTLIEYNADYAMTLIKYNDYASKGA